MMVSSVLLDGRGSIWQRNLLSIAALPLTKYQINVQLILTNSNTDRDPSVAFK